MAIIRIGLDTSKHVFQLHGVDEAEQPVLRKRLRRGEMEKFFAELAPTRIGLEACGASHHWARTLSRLGHEVFLLPPQYVKPYVKRGKTDAGDAEAIPRVRPKAGPRTSCEAMSRPGMRFVPIKSAEQQAALMLIRVREQLVRQRTMLINAIRGHAAEFGITRAKGVSAVPALLERVRVDEHMPALARDLVGLLADQLATVEAKLKEVEARLMVWHRQNAVSRLLATVPGVGPIGAVTFALKIPDPSAFRSGRHFAAWIGLTPKTNSTAGRHRLGKISRQGDEDLRRLLVLGATAVIQHAKPDRASPWLLALLARRPRKLAAVALANKMARIVWAMMVSGETYRRPQEA